MIKFFKIQGTEIRRAVDVIDDHHKTILGYIGQVKELVERNLIFRDNTEGNMDKWLFISCDAQDIREFRDLATAKAAVRAGFEPPFPRVVSSFERKDRE